MNQIAIKNVTPAAALPGGEVRIEYAGPPFGEASQPDVRFGASSGQLMLASQDLLVVKVPDNWADSPSEELRVTSNGGESRPYRYEVGKRVASNLHPVSNPAVDTEGNVYVTFSGRRGQETPVSIYKVTPKGAVTPFVTDIRNATGLAFGLEGDLYVSSRNDGSVYRVAPSGTPHLFMEGMGTATGIAFDREGALYVGDRSGTIFKIGSGREVFVFATLEPSVAAYHLAFGMDSHLYVTGPTTSSFDSIYRIAPGGAVEKFYTGLGRPQGMAFDIEGALYIAASHRGRRGIFRFRGRIPELVVAGVGLVGLAFDYSRSLLVADSGSLYRVQFGVDGKPLP